MKKSWAASAESTQDLADSAEEITKAILAYATDSGDLDLAGKAAYTKTDFQRGADKTIVHRAETLSETATEVVDLLDEHGITQAKLTAFDKKVDAFRKAYPTPRQRVTASSAATKQIKKLCGQLSALLRKRLDRLMVQFRASSPDFYNEYKAARVIVDPATREKKDESKAA